MPQPNSCCLFSNGLYLSHKPCHTVSQYKLHPLSAKAQRSQCDGNSDLSTMPEDMLTYDHCKIIKKSTNITQIVIHLGQSSIYWSYALAFICIQKAVGSKDKFHPELRKLQESLLHCLCQKTFRVEWHIPDPSLPTETQDNIETWAIMNRARENIKAGALRLLC